MGLCKVQKYRVKCDMWSCGKETDYETVSKKALPSKWGYSSEDSTYCPECFREYVIRQLEKGIPHAKSYWESILQNLDRKEDE